MSRRIERQTGPSPLDEPDAGFELFEERPPPGLLRRYLVTQRHFVGLLQGGLVAWVASRPPRARRGLRFRLLQVLSWIARPCVSRRYVDLPFPTQLRKRLEALGPTYIKLGQILSLREDLLPTKLTDELKKLLDRLPALPFDRFVELVEAEIDDDVDNAFSWVGSQPIGSASIGQTHRARTLAGREVVLKLVKPGIRRTIERDVFLLRILGFSLQLFAARYQPRRVINEFCAYTLREVDLLREADNAEIFAANFEHDPDIVFPRILRRLSTRNLLCMEYLDGLKPDAAEAQQLLPSDKERLTDLGAAAIIQMLYADGFFHADLHPGNLLILPGPRVGFVDLGMVGRFDEDLRRNLLYYYYCLVMGDSDNAARYLTALAEPGAKGDPRGFRREVEEISSRWQLTPNFRDYSLGQLILDSVSRGARYRMYFPVELVLMVKAIVTFEGVGQILNPGFDVVELSKVHIGRIFLKQFSPLRIAREGLRGAPDLVDALVKAPMLVTEGLRVLEQATRQPRENPFTGIRGTVLAGFLFVSGALVLVLEGPMWLWIVLFGAGILLAVGRGDR